MTLWQAIQLYHTIKHLGKTIPNKYCAQSIKS
jgi:hypothetical protein